MTFEIGDKVATNSGLYLSGAWREAGLKGKVTVEADSVGLLTVKFKGLDVPRFIRPEYLTLREKKAEIAFQEGDAVVFAKTYSQGLTVEVVKGIWADVVKVHPKRGEVTVEFDDYTTLRVPADHLSTEDEYFDGEEKATDEPDFDSEEGEAIPDLHEVKDNPEVQAALALVLARIEEIKTLLTTKPQNEVHIYTTVNEASFVTPEVEEEPAPEPVFKKAKEVAEGDSLYTEAGVWDKVSRIETKDSGYTSLYGAFGNKIVQVPSGRVVQVLEEVA